MNGIDYSVPYTHTTGEARKFVSTAFVDLERFMMTIDDQTDWTQVAKAVVASGNFPIAFQPEMLRREMADYPNAKPEDNDFLPEHLAFLDGGIFNNEPLREAVAQAAIADGGIVDPDRIFILIDPNMNRSSQDRAIPQDIPLEKQMMRLINMVLGESAARDWMQAQKKNAQLDWHTHLIEILGSLIPTDVPDSVGTELTAETNRIVNHKRNLFPDRYPANYLEKALAKIRNRHSTIHNGLSTRQQDVFEQLVFMVNNVSGLQNKSPIQLSFIGSDKEKTAGDQLFSFGGFFDEAWREHDYRQGRIATHELLPDIFGQTYAPETDANDDLLEDYTIPSEWSNFPSVTLEQADRNLREQFRDLAVNRVMRIVETYISSRIGRWFARRYLVKKMINKFLKL